MEQNGKYQNKSFNMKNIILSLAFLTPFFISAQKITSEFDKFLKEKRVETGWCSVRPTLKAPLSIKLRAVGIHSYFVTISGANYGANVIGSDATIIFLLDDQSTLTAKSTGIQSYDIGEYSKSYRHQYTISREDLDKLAIHDLKSIRKSDTDTYFDFDIESKNGTKLKNLIVKFLKDVDKE
jgi:hypothetical protein